MIHQYDHPNPQNRFTWVKSEWFGTEKARVELRQNDIQNVNLHVRESQLAELWAIVTRTFTALSAISLSDICETLRGNPTTRASIHDQTDISRDIGNETFGFQYAHYEQTCTLSFYDYDAHVQIRIQQKAKDETLRVDLINLGGVGNEKIHNFLLGIYATRCPGGIWTIEGAVTLHQHVDDPGNHSRERILKEAYPNLTIRT